LRTIGERDDYSCGYFLLAILVHHPFHSTNEWGALDNTVPFMNWVVIENTFVVIGASIPLIRPLFSRTRKLSMSMYGGNTAYEMNSRSQGGAKSMGPFSAAQNKSIALQSSSSEENILHGPDGSKATTIISHNPFNNENDVEKGITKETTVHVKYTSENDAISNTEPKWDFRK
jgi:hypothetical protein